MLKLKRAAKQIRNCTGETIFESDFFRVIIWATDKGPMTTVDLNTYDIFELHFEGKLTLTSDFLCMAQLEVEEILALLTYQKEISFREGEQDRAQKIRSLLAI